MNRLLGAAKESVQSGRVGYLEIRGWGSPVAPEELGLTGNVYYLSHVVHLHGDPEKLRNSIILKGGAHLKRNLKRAENSELRVRDSQGEDDLRKFYRLTILTRRKHHLLPWPYEFLEAIYHNMIVAGHGFLLLAELNDRVIAGSMFFHFKDTVTLKFNASDDRYSQSRANYLVTWKAIERAAHEGYRHFDFGITDPWNQGLLRFKRQWGSVERKVHYYYYPALHITSPPKISTKYKLYVAMNRCLPEFAAKLLGRALYRQLG